LTPHWGARPARLASACVCPQGCCRSGARPHPGGVAGGFAYVVGLAAWWLVGTETWSRQYGTAEAESAVSEQASLQPWFGARGFVAVRCGARGAAAAQHVPWPARECACRIHAVPSPDVGFFPLFQLGIPHLDVRAAAKAPPSFYQYARGPRTKPAKQTAHRVRLPLRRTPRAPADGSPIESIMRGLLPPHWRGAPCARIVPSRNVASHPAPAVLRLIYFVPLFCPFSFTLFLFSRAVLFYFI